MRGRFLNSVIAVATSTVAVGTLVAVLGTQTSGQGPKETTAVVKTAALQTPWGEPDLQGIWTVEYDTPFQRSPRFANQEFFTDAQRAEFDRMRSQNRGRDERGSRGSELDVVWTRTLLAWVATESARI